MIDLSGEHLEEVRRILREHVPGVEVRAFGSRVQGQAREYSDLDLALVGDATFEWRQIEVIKDAFSESGLPFMVDVLDWHAISASFRAAIAKRGFEVIQDKARPDPLVERDHRR